MLLQTTYDLDFLIWKLDHPELGTEIGLDTEAHGKPLINLKGKEVFNPHECTLTGYSVAFSDGSAYYVPVAHSVGTNAPVKPALQVLHRIVEWEGRTVWAHNWKFEHGMLSNFPVRCKVADSMLLLWMLGLPAPGKHQYGLKPLSEHHLGVKEATTFAQVTQGRSANEINPEDLYRYAANDALYTLQLGRQFVGKLSPEEASTFWNVECPLTRVLRDMESTGIALDFNVLDSASGELELSSQAMAERFKTLTTCRVMVPEKVRVLSGESFKNGKPKLVTKEVERCRMVGADITSAKQVARWCYDELKVWPKSQAKLTPGGSPSTDAETMAGFTALSGLGGELAQLRLKFQAAHKLLSTYTKPLPHVAKQYADKRIHGSFIQQGTRTGRLSSRGPNLQQLPRPVEGLPDIRSAFVARPGYVLVGADYSQIELRVMAHYSRDPAMLRAYRDNLDIHQMTMDALGVDRVTAKMVNFSTIYCITAQGLARRLHVDEDTASGFIEGYFDTYPRVAWYQREAINRARQRGYVHTMLGRRRRLDFAKGERHKDSNRAVNSPIQGTAADIMKVAMLAVYSEFANREGWYLLAQVHDELLCEVPEGDGAEAAKLLQRCMENVPLKLRVPLVAEPSVGKCWSELK